MMLETNFMFVDTENLGYGRMGVKLKEALQRTGVYVQDGLEGRKCNSISWMAVPSHATGWYEGQYNSVLTMWESQNLPETYRENLHEFDLIMVPSEQNLELFSAFHDNVQYVPLGIDPDAWTFRERLPVEDEFRFLIGGSGSRKGLDLVHKAYMRLWGDGWGSGPKPVVYFKSPNGRVMIHQDFQEVDLPLLQDRMFVVPGRLTNQEEIDLYGYCHAYLQPSRGEGFGMQPLQAIAQGCPTILTDAHGHKSFSHLGYGISTTSSKAGYFYFGDAGEWWEPDLDGLCDWMLYVYENYDHACEFARKSSQIAREQFTWANTAQAWIDAVGVDNLGPYTGDGTWHEPSLQRFPMVLTEKWVGNIAGIKYAFEPQVEYYELASVKRILCERGIVHPDYVTATQGMSPEQVARFGKTQGEHAYCPSCLQRLNSQPTKADDIEAGIIQ